MPPRSFGLLEAAVVRGGEAQAPAVRQALREVGAPYALPLCAASLVGCPLGSPPGGEPRAAPRPPPTTVGVREQYPSERMLGERGTFRGHPRCFAKDAAMMAAADYMLRC